MQPVVGSGTHILTEVPLILKQAEAASDTWTPLSAVALPGSRVGGYWEKESLLSKLANLPKHRSAYLRVRSIQQTSQSDSVGQITAD